jgi:hypothetical protein
MQECQDALIRVQTEWNGWRTATVRLRDLGQLHWLQPDRAPCHLVHGYVACTDLVAGQLAHDCTGSPAPHRLLVCVIKHHNGTEVYAEAARRADAALAAAERAPRWRLASGRHSAHVWR